MTIQILLETLIAQKDLTKKEVLFFVDQVAQGMLLPTHVAAFLALLRAKGESVEEIVSLIEGMRKHMITIPAQGIVLDTCGTGGDKSNSFNISTATALVVAACGVKVAKHGNRAASSLCGSADVLEALGVHITLTPQQAASVLEQVGMVFLFAPLYHPAMKYIGPIRKELGVRTVFNFLGPFLNPAVVTHQIIGVPDKKIAATLAKVASKLHYKHLIIVTSQEGLDEIGIGKATNAFVIKGKMVQRMTIHSEKLGIANVSKEAYRGGTKEENAQIIRRILDGKLGPGRDIVLINAAYGLLAANKVKTVRLGMQMAQEAIDSGKAKAVLDALIKETNRYA